MVIKNYKQDTYPKGDITQWFGENKELYMRAIGTIGHNGIDIVAPWGTPLYAVEDGLVVDVKDTPDGYGKHIRFLSDKYEWTYGHLSKIFVNTGQEIKAGDLIGNMGNTGFVVSGATPYWKYNPFAGTHLHLGVREYKKSRRGWQYNSQSPRIKILNYNNGYFGAIDPAPLLSQEFVGSQKILTPKTLVSFLNWLKSKGFLRN